MIHEIKQLLQYNSSTIHCKLLTTISRCSSIHDIHYNYPYYVQIYMIVQVFKYTPELWLVTFKTVVNCVFWMLNEL